MICGIFNAAVGEAAAEPPGWWDRGLRAGKTGGGKGHSEGLGWLGTPRPSLPEHHPEGAQHPPQRDSAVLRQGRGGRGLTEG